MRVNLNVQFPVISSKQQVPNPKFYPLILSRLQGEILKIPRSPFRFRNGNGEFGKSSTPECVGLWFIAQSWSQ